MQTGFENLPVKCSSFDGHNVILTDCLIWTWRGKRYRGIVGAGSDGASTPQISWNVLPPFGWYWPAALAHDLVYRAEAEVQLDDGSWLRIQMPFDDCNAMLLDLMTSLQTSPLQEAEKMLIYEAVSKAGQTAFSDDLAKPIVI
jgi:Protein of unknown function (DUF1353)